MGGLQEENNMKKLAIIAILAAVTGVASAADVGLHIGRGAGANGAGVVVGQNFGKLGVEAAFDRTVDGTVNVNRYSVVGSYPVATFANVTFAAKAGAAFTDPAVGVNGYSAVVGVGVSYPVTKTVSLVADYAYQRGQDRVSFADGNYVSAGLKYSF